MISFTYIGEFPSITAQASKKLRSYIIKTPTKTFSRASMYISSKGKEAVKTWIDILSPHAPEKPYDVTCKLELVLVFPYTKTDEAYLKRTNKIQKALGLPPIEYLNYTRADTDNLEKMLKDCAVKAKYLTDDKHVCISNVVKVKGPQAKFIFRLIPLEPEELDKLVCAL